MLTKLLIAFLFPFLISTEGGKSFNDVKNQAKTENKKILLNFSGSDWCLPCIKMEKEVFSTAAFQDFAQTKLIIYRADFPRDEKKISKEQKSENAFLADTYNKDGHFPYTVLMDAEGKVIHVWDGYTFSNIQDFLNELSTFL